jgi:hypothetical protein
MPAKIRRLWTSYVTLVGRLCYPHPHGINLFISKLLQNLKSCVTPTPIGYDFLYSDTIRKNINREYHQFYVANWNKYELNIDYILHLQRMAGI